MYEQTFDTEWATLPREACVRRAFALGVAAALGHPDPEEYDRLVAEPDSAYDRSLVELAYSKGRNEGQTRRREADDPTAVWTDLVADDPAVSAESASEGSTTPGPSGSLPSALTRPGRSDVPTDDPPGALGVPSFLTSDGE